MSSLPVIKGLIKRHIYFQLFTLLLSKIGLWLFRVSLNPNLNTYYVIFFFTAMRYQKESSLICQVNTDTGHPLVDLCRPDVFTTLLKNVAFSLVLRFMSVAIGIHMLYFFYFGTNAEVILCTICIDS